MSTSSATSLSNPSPIWNACATPWKPRAPPPDEEQAKSRRKKEGAFYTPAFITRYIVQQALGGVLKDRFEILRQRLESETAGTGRKPLLASGAGFLTRSVFNVA